ncbi:head-tail joining protein [Paenirhodobacter enshiensis]|uniref:Uncharacterized protein n=1 Tax=Paenirhodobacter enshiensis TaxID=1105367 RepID=A0A086XQR3_9RHOB|nr:hypothetical protein [Paenirhodobacter enshiensis]KFI24363.1 hypothetical protein CG50_10500 [Paenirhodobacter enshiensis]
MSAFATATAALFRDPNLAQDAVWRPGGAGAPVAVRVVLRRPDAVTGFGEGRFVTDSVMIDVECAALLGALAPGDTFDIGGVIYEVRGAPLRDALRHVWKAEAREA